MVRVLELLTAAMFGATVAFWATDWIASGSFTFFATGLMLAASGVLEWRGSKRRGRRVQGNKATGAEVEA